MCFGQTDLIEQQDKGLRQLQQTTLLSRARLNACNAVLLKTLSSKLERIQTVEIKFPVDNILFHVCSEHQLYN